MSMHDCPTCGQTFNVRTVPGDATPGTYQTWETRVPVEDVFGRVEGHKISQCGRWVSAGPPVEVTSIPDDGGPSLTYRWPCGDHTATLQFPAYDREQCRYCAPDAFLVSGGRQTRCSCCGGNPSHAIARDPELRVLPRCMQATPRSA